MSTVRFFAEHFRIGILTDPVLQVGLIIVYVYVVCLVIAFFARIVLRKLVDFVGRSNFLWLRNTIAQERGIAAYRAWVPFERIRPAHIPQEKWEESFAWPAEQLAALPAAGAAYLARGHDLCGRAHRCRPFCCKFLRRSRS